MGDLDITVGALVSVSGKYQRQGLQALNGILLWQSWINAQGGIRVGSVSRPIRLIWHDDESRTCRAREVVLRLLQQDRVEILFGPYSSSLTMSAAEIAEEQKKLLWNYGGTSDEIFNKGWQCIIAISSPASDYFRALPRWIAREYPKLRRVCALYSAKGTFAGQVIRGLIETARAIGHSVLLVPLNAVPADVDTALSALGKINPEAIVLAANFQDELTILQTRSLWPNTACVTAAVAAGMADFGSHAQHASERVIGPSQWEPGASSSTILGPDSEWFVDNFRKQFRTIPGYVAAGGFATGLIVGECIRRTSSLNSDQLRATASGLECETFYGHFRIDPQSGKQLDHRVLIVQWQNGKKVLLTP